MSEPHVPHYGYYEGSDKVTLIERPVWRVYGPNEEVIALCLSEQHAIEVAAALNDLAVGD